MKKPYHILDSAKQQRVSPDELTRLLSQNGQLMLPLVNLIEQCRGAVDEVIDVTGRAAIQAVLELSAQQVTGGELSPTRQEAWRRGAALGPAIGPRESQRPQAAGGQAALCANAPAARSKCPPTKPCRTTSGWARACWIF